MKFEADVWCWLWQLKFDANFEFIVWGWGLRLKFKVWGLKLKLEIETWAPLFWKCSFVIDKLCDVKTEQFLFFYLISFLLFFLLFELRYYKIDKKMFNWFTFSSKNFTSKVPHNLVLIFFIFVDDLKTTFQHIFSW